MERNNRPLDTIRDGRIKVVIWENRNDKGDIYHTMTPSKTYEDRDGNLKDSHSFSMSEGLRAAALIQDGRTVILSRQKELAQLRDNTRDGPSQEGRQDRFQDQSRPEPGMGR